MLTQELKDKAVNMYSQTGLKAVVAKSVGCCVKTIEREQKRDKKFDEAMREAKDFYVDTLINTARERAMSGTSKMADTLLMFLIKKERPEYRDKYDINAKIEGNIKIISAVPRPEKSKPGKKPKVVK